MHLCGRLTINQNAVVLFGTPDSSSQIKFETTSPFSTMMNRLFLAFALQAAVSSGAKTHHRKSNIRSRSLVGRHLSQNLLPWFRTSPKVDSCWGGMETKMGERQPVITCEFHTHEQ